MRERTERKRREKKETGEKEREIESFSCWVMGQQNRDWCREQ